jgi:hypothetical protein
MPFGRKIDKMAVKKYQHLPLQDLPKFTQSRFFGLKIYHLATLGPSFAIPLNKQLSDQCVRRTFSFTNLSMYTQAKCFSHTDNSSTTNCKFSWLNVTYIQKSLGLKNMTVRTNLTKLGAKLKISLVLSRPRYNGHQLLAYLVVFVATLKQSP